MLPRFIDSSALLRESGSIVDRSHPVMVRAVLQKINYYIVLKLQTTAQG